MAILTLFTIKVSVMKGMRNVAGSKWYREGKYGPGPIYLLVLVAFLAIILTGLHWMARYKTVQYKRETTAFHTLPAAPRVLVAPEEQIVVSDTSVYAGNEFLTLYMYADFYYNADRLMAEADYDKEGNLLSKSQWEYDAAGNLIQEQTESEADGLWTNRYIYEYDEAGNVVHQKVYWDENLAEDNYFRFTDFGRAGVSFSYLDDRADGGISQYCSERMEFVEDAEGKLLYMFNFNGPETVHSRDACKKQWVQSGDHLISREQYYTYDAIRYSTRSDWYQDIEAANQEQFNLYEYDSETKRRNRILEVNYEWLSDQEKFELSPSFYRAKYDGDNLLWQIEYTDGILTYYSACQYDADGQLQSGVEYRAGEEEAYTLVHRYEYLGRDKIGKYSYELWGTEFEQSLGEEESALLTFSDTGILTEIRLTDAMGNVSEQYEFVESGESAGRIEKMYVDGETTTGENAVLEKMEAEAEAYGFRAGEDLESSNIDV